MTQITILFMCPHNAAKSLLAAAYYRFMAREHGLAWHILTGGTDPNDAPMHSVLTLLHAEGLPLPDAAPHRVTPAEWAAAVWVISLACDLAGWEDTGKQIAYWDDVPPPSQDLNGARQAILQHLEHLMAPHL